MKVSTILFCLVAACGPISLKGQTNFKSGYYITASDDTVRGYIEYRSELRNYDVCIFRQNLNSQRTSLSPDIIKGYVILDKVFYETHPVKKKNSEEIRRGFMQVLVRGKLSLLRNHGRFFAKDSLNQIFEITKRNIELEANLLQEDYRGLGYLKILMNDCRAMQLDSLEKQFQITPDFVEIFRRYYECIGKEPLVTQRIAIKPYVQLGVQASAAFNRLKFTEDLEKASFSYRVNPGLGGFASLFVPRLGERFSIIAESNFGIYRDRTTFSKSVYYSNGTLYSTTVNDLSIDFAYVKIPLLVRYNFGKFYIEAGTQYQFMFYQNIGWKTRTIYQAVHFDGRRDYSLDDSTRGYLAGVGFTYNIRGYNLRSSLRYSRIKTTDHPNDPVFQTIEFFVGIPLR